MALPISLPLALPLATGALAYLDARWSLSYDLSLLSANAASGLSQALAAYRDKLSLFYTLEAHAQSSRAGHTFLVFEGRRWSYAQAYENALKYGSWLKALGVRKGEIVAIDFCNGDAMVWVWLGLWAIGARPAMINYNLTGAPLVHCVRASKAGLVVVDAEVRERFSEEVMGELVGKDGSRVVFFDAEMQKGVENGVGVRDPDEARSGQRLHDMAQLIYTSGTTGLPKPAIVSWTKVFMGASFIARWVPLRKDDVIYTCMPLYHSTAGLLALCATIQAGATIALGRRFSNRTFWPEVEASGATIIQYVGETCRYLLAAPPSPADRAHRVRLAYGNGMRPDVWNGFKERFNIPEICEFYAATEGPSAMFNKSRNDFSAGAVGRNGKLAQLVLGNMISMVKLDYETNEPLRDPNTGLCVVAGWNEPAELLYKLDPNDVAAKFQGYFGNTKATSSKILRDVKAKGDAWYRTGDVLRWDLEGRWYFVDRIGDTFRWKSENVSTAEVAEVVGKCPGVLEANVYGVLVPRHDGRAGCAAIVLDGSTGEKQLEPSEALLTRLAEHVTANLPRYALPLFLRFTGEMQSTGTNKQQKHHLREEGIEPEKVAPSGDRLFWLKEGRYVPFGQAEWQALNQGGVKL